MDSNPDKCCQLCYEEKPDDQIHKFSCPYEHVLCSECYYYSLSESYIDGDTHVCPLCKICDLSTAGNSSNGAQELKEEKCEELNEEHIPHLCSFCKENRLYYSYGQKNEDNCPKSSSHPCTHCQNLDHYKMICPDILFCVGKYQYWRLNLRYKRAKQRAEYYNKQEEYKANEEKYKQEEWKIWKQNKTLYNALCEGRSTSYVYCPACRKLLLHACGDDMMICGKFHSCTSGGCGYHFSFCNSQNVICGYRIEEIIEYFCHMPSFEDNVQHSDCYSCAICGKKPITGIRFGCIECPGVYFCEDCECDRINEHFNGEHMLNVIFDPNQA